eukprot:scaffold2010_cov301-Prasinococcus_capsulatus_cf.AAC.3
MLAWWWAQAYGTRFYLDDKPFLFTGCNSYYLMEAAAAGNHAAVDEVLNDAIAKGTSRRASATLRKIATQREREGSP